MNDLDDSVDPPHSNPTPAPQQDEFCVSVNYSDIHSLRLQFCAYFYYV